MKLTKIAILALKGTGQDVKERIAQAAGITNTGTVYNWITDNKDNGNLTKASVVKVIEEATGLTQDQILEECDVIELKDTAA